MYTYIYIYIYIYPYPYMHICINIPAPGCLAQKLASRSAGISGSQSKIRVFSDPTLGKS